MHSPNPCVNQCDKSLLKKTSSEKRQIEKDIESISVILGWGWEQGLTANMHARDVWGVMHKF